MKNKLILLRDIFLNIFFSRKYDLYFIVENANWVVDCEWKSISDTLNKNGYLKSKISSTPLGLRNKIVHFGSLNTLVSRRGLKKVHSSNQIILTWFHIVSGDARLKFVDEIKKKTTLVHTSCEITKEKLIKYGFAKEKIVVIPLGIDLSIFKPASPTEKMKFKESLGISEDSFVIGSFQKDGNGWGEGNEPKLIKGPDIFCDIVEKLSLKYPIHVLLTGPARGYVINRLIKANIKYTHVYLKNFFDIVSYYQILDLYLIGSREEGGPKALLESMACGVPMVTTRVGMAPEIIKDGENGYLTEVDDRDILFSRSSALLDDSALRNRLAKNGLSVIKEYDYDLIAKRFWNEIYNFLFKK